MKIDYLNHCIVTEDGMVDFTDVRRILKEQSAYDCFPIIGNVKVVKESGEEVDRMWVRVATGLQIGCQWFRNATVERVAQELL